MTVACAKCLARKAAGLRPQAARVAEETLLAAAEQLERRHSARPCPQLSNAIALHYLLLADHPEVASCCRRRDGYQQQAAAWIRLAERVVTHLRGSATDIPASLFDS
jgi:hypothetical protein